MKIMKQRPSSEMKLINEQKIKLLKLKNTLITIVLTCFFIPSCKSKSIEDKILGNWAIKSVKTVEGEIINVPEEEYYELCLDYTKQKRIFKVGNVSGNWVLDDSLLIFENIPESKTYIDSIFVLNDEFGNSSVILQSGNEKIATISSNGVQPETVTSTMKLILIENNEIHLFSNGDTYIYTKVKKH